MSFFRKEKEVPYIGSVVTDSEKAQLKKAFAENGITTAAQARDHKLIKKACRRLPFIKNVGSVPGKDNRGLIQVQFNGNNRVGQGDFSFVFA